MIDFFALVRNLENSFRKSFEELQNFALLVLIRCLNVQIRNIHAISIYFKSPEPSVLQATPTQFDNSTDSDL